MFSLFFAFSVIFTSEAANCKPGEYYIHELCCPMCNAGSVVKIHCSQTSPSIVCVPCVDGTYIDHPNGLTKCSKCTECDTGAGLQEVKKCAYISNTECECKRHYYCTSNEKPCDLCSKYTTCRPGQYVKEQGTSTSDNVCEICPDESFSTLDMSMTCTPWTKCSEQNGVETKPGTKTTDCVCVDKRNLYTRIGIIAFIFFSFCLSLWLVIKKFPEMVPRTNVQCEDADMPVQDTEQQNA